MQKMGDKIPTARRNSVSRGGKNMAKDMKVQVDYSNQPKQKVQPVKEKECLDSRKRYFDDRKKYNANVVAADVLIQDPLAIDQLRMGGNKLFIPVSELNILKRLVDVPGIGGDALEVLRKIDTLTLAEATDLIIYNDYDYSIIDGLENKNKDCDVIAAASHILNLRREEFRRVKLISLNPMIRLLATKQVKLLTVEDYNKAHIYLEAKKEPLKEIKVKTKLHKFDYDQDRHYYFFNYNKLIHGEIAEDECVICRSDWSATGSIHDICERRFVATRLGTKMIITQPSDGTLFGLMPYSRNEDYNWEQLAATYKLKDNGNKYDMYLIAGTTGSGKSLYGYAAALERRHQFDEIIVIATMTHAGGKDTIGFLPGSLEQKIEVWEGVASDCLKILEKFAPKHGIKPDNTKKKKDPKKSVEKPKTAKQKNRRTEEDGQDFEVKEKNGWLFRKLKNDGVLTFIPLNYLRGRTLTNTLIIVEDAQNLTRADMKLINTRMGPGSVVIYNGDNDQTDKETREHNITRIKNGFANAWIRFDRPGTARISLVKTVRSSLAEYSEKMS